MHTLLVVLHVLVVVIVIGPAMLYPFTALKAFEGQKADELSQIGRWTMIFNGLTLVAALVGVFAALTADTNIFGEVWMIIASTLYVLALINGIGLLPMIMANAAKTLRNGEGQMDADRISQKKGQIMGFAAANAVFYILITVLMTWQP
ncbi:hypothetical protein [Salininema proteolyticum]|uniref:Integral membrane protein DUF2269 n=1 Tax=Salininema proteolyticum TaxID=1607685 RepID=A0ABV8U084_9ACTN